VAAMLESELAAAFKAMLDATHAIEKIEWWLQFAHENVRWLQFELGFWLSKQLGEGYAVGCEQKHVDLVIYERKPDVFPLWNNFPIVNVELKVQGNWYATKDVFPKIARDLVKIDLFGQPPECRPGIALAIWFFAVPKKSAHQYRWITEQVVSEMGLDSSQAIETRMHKEFDGKFKRLSVWRSPEATDDFDVHEAHLYCFQNEAALRSQDFAN
jgi:hypothetical protein